MHDYVYRIDRKKYLFNITDNLFRARLWKNRQSDFPHKNLRAAFKTRPSDRDVYRICFWGSMSKAEQSLERDYGHWGDGIITRFLKEDVLAQGFEETWDDGFAEGDAYLFWKYDSSGDDPSLSYTGLKIERADALVDGNWVPLSEFLISNAVASPPVPASSPLPEVVSEETVVPAPRSRLLSRLWKWLTP